MSDDQKVLEHKESSDNSRGIPPAKFIENVVDFVNSSSQTVDQILSSLQALYGKYKFMEAHLVQQQKALVTKIPDIKNALDALRFLMKQKNDASVHFQLSDSIYANATIPAEAAEKKTVLLWLGANVMLEYTQDEAEQLLVKNLNNAETNLSTLEQDLSYLKDQITISEVNIARLHNYKVTLKQAEKSTIKA